MAICRSSIGTTSAATIPSKAQAIVQATVRFRTAEIELLDVVGPSLAEDVEEVPSPAACCSATVAVTSDILNVIKQSPHATSNDRHVSKYKWGLILATGSTAFSSRFSILSGEVLLS